MAFGGPIAFFRPLADSGAFSTSQVALLTTPDSRSRHLCLTGIWDTKNAVFNVCFLPIVSLIAVSVIAVILLLQCIYFTTRWRPQWTRPFVDEVVEDLSETELQLTKRRRSLNAVCLLALSFIGTTLSVVQVVQAWTGVINLAVLVPWLSMLALTVVHMPRTAPMDILTIAAIQVTENGIRLAALVPYQSTLNTGFDAASIALSVLIVAVILSMPFRHPDKPTADISAAFSPPDSTLRSPEDNLSVWQFSTVSWMAPLISVGTKRQLHDEDVWQLGHEFQHRRLHDNFRLLKGTVIQRLLKANVIDLIILTVLGLIDLATQTYLPLGLQQLLATMEDPTAPKRATIIYATLLLVVRLISTQIGVYSLWFGRRCYERSRGEMITMLYEKTLGRKIAFVERSADDKDADKSAQEEADEEDAKSKLPWWTRWTRRCRELLSSRQEAQTAKEPASMGKILNLMRNDVYEVAQRFWEFQLLITQPLSAVVAVWLVLDFLGPSAWLAVAWLVATQILTWAMSRLLIYFEKKRRAATDSKLQMISQFVEAIRHLRWYGWQSHWLKKVLTARQRELTLRMVSNVWQIAINFFTSLGGDLAPVIAFFAYTTVAKQPLRVDIVFPAIQIFSLLDVSLKALPGLIIVIINAWVAVDRIEDFMAEPTREDMNTEALVGDDMSLEHASFAWPGISKPVLTDVNVSFPPGITVVCGEVASGKTALLQALLGELDMRQGQLFRPRDPIAYCAQTPWLQSMSIRENILFSAPYEDGRYKSVLDACALTSDLAEFKAGDLSMIGENGVGLSGGQRARVALARAVYSRNNILLLDDPLSALDQQTAESIVQKCFNGPLFEGRTAVLVTHRTDLVFGIARQVVRMVNGRAIVLPQTSASDSGFQHLAPTISRDDENDQKNLEEQIEAAVPDKFIEDEHRQHGGVQLQVYWEYVKAGKLRWWALLVVSLVIFRLAATGGAYFLKIWSEAYDRNTSFVIFHDSVSVLNRVDLDLDFTKDWPSPENDVTPWLMTYGLLSLAQSVSFIFSQGVMLVIVYVAARRMFSDIIDKVAHATFRFYDVTPIGRLMNRMTSDIGVIDGNISRQLQQVAWLTILWLSSVSVIAFVTPSFSIFMLALVATFIFVFLRFLPTSQSLRRLEMVSLTPLMSNFGALLNGLTTVRAFGVQERFQDRVLRVVDTFQKMDHFYWSLQSWLMYRYNVLSDLSTFILTLIALATNVSPGLTAFVLLNANRYVEATHRLCKQYGELQMEFVSVERVVELIHLEQEPKGTVSPPAWWPSFSGDITFKNVKIRYAPHLDPALDDISFTLKGGSKTAIVGRTGSGKSTLALAILATILPTEGQIKIDNVDLAEVDKQLLRTRITFLAQDPVLFPGSMRQNLDPVNEHTDAACEAVLARVCERQGWQLDTPIEAGGKNLSQGQRQLVGLARAVLRRSAIIVLDEATASIDRETAMQIQQAMHEEMKDSTVITIAHRLEAVRKADYCIVLGKGKILRQGPAAEMLKESREDMVEDSELDE